MTIPPLPAGPEDSRPRFRELAALARPAGPALARAHRAVDGDDRGLRGGRGRRCHPVAGWTGYLWTVPGERKAGVIGMANVWQRALFYLGLVDEDESAPEAASPAGLSGTRYRPDTGPEESPVTVTPARRQEPGGPGCLRPAAGGASGQPPGIRGPAGGAAGGAPAPHQRRGCPDRRRGDPRHDRLQRGAHRGRPRPGDPHHHRPHATPTRNCWPTTSAPARRWCSTCARWNRPWCAGWSTSPAG